MSSLDYRNGRATPAHAAQKETPHQGQGDKENNFDTGNDTALAQELSYTVKPEVDLQSWAALGGNAKPSRTDRRQKRSWRRAAR
jgi:hypothetical protein